MSVNKKTLENCRHKDVSTKNVEFAYKDDLYKDPAHWPAVLLDKIELMLIEVGPTHLNEMDISNFIYYKKRK